MLCGSPPPRVWWPAGGDESRFRTARGKEARSAVFEAADGEHFGTLTRAVCALQKWKEVLSAEEYYVLRQKGTEPPRTGEYDKHFEEGTYNCRACGTPLYT